MKPRRRTILSLGLSLLAAPRAVLAAAVASTKNAASDDGIQILRDDAVYGDKLARRVLYTWTTQEQIDALRKSKLLLSREESPQHGPSHYDLVMQALAGTGHPVAKLLRGAAFRRARFAWANPWATLQGWATESYGEKLLRVTLRDEAYVAAYSTTTRQFRFFDLRHRQVAQKTVLATPQRLAAVYFVEDSPRRGTQRGTFATGASAPYREYVLCNEAMIAAYEAGTDATALALRRGLSAIGSLLKKPDQLLRPSWSWAEAQPARWGKNQPPTAARDAYELGLAFANPFYFPGAEQLDRLHKSLEKALASQPAPLFEAKQPLRP